MSTFACVECFDTRVIDRGGAEIPCPYCHTLKLTGLRSGLGSVGAVYATAVAHTSTTITFSGTPAMILADVRAASAAARRAVGSNKRDSASSAQFAIERRVRAALAERS